MTNEEQIRDLLAARTRLYERQQQCLEALYKTERALEAALADAAALRQALFDYGEHTEACILSGLDKPCVCGLTKIRNIDHPGAALMAELALARAVLERLSSKQTRAALAELAHAQWSGWMEYLFKCGTTHGDAFTIQPWAVERWVRQMRTPYDQLPEEERLSDLAEADRVLAILARSTDANTE